MAMTKREKRVVDAFINCIKAGEYTEDYAITLIEDESRYGWMSSEAKDYFYTSLAQPLSEKGYYVLSPFLANFFNSFADHGGVLSLLWGSALKCAAFT